MAFTIGELSAVIAGVATVSVALANALSAHQLEGRKVRTEFMKDRQKEVFLIRDRVRGERERWMPFLDEDAQEYPQEVMADVRSKISGLRATIIALRDAQPYFDPIYFPNLSDRIREASEAADVFEYVKNYMPEPSEGFGEAMDLVRATTRLLNIAEGVSILTIEYMFAYFESRAVNDIYCARIRHEYLTIDGE